MVTGAKCPGSLPSAAIWLLRNFYGWRIIEWLWSRLREIRHSAPLANHNPLGLNRLGSLTRLIHRVRLLLWHFFIPCHSKTSKMIVPKKSCTRPIVDLETGLSFLRPNQYEIGLTKGQVCFFFCRSRAAYIAAASARPCTMAAKAPSAAFFPSRGESQSMSHIPNSALDMM